MKTLSKIYFSLFIILIISSCGVKNETQNEATSSEISSENLISTDYSIEGMVCAMGCAATIEKEVSGMNGIVVSEVNFETGKGHFEFDKSIVSEKEIIAKIEIVANGQYKVGEWVDKDNSEEELELEDDIVSDGNEESMTKISLPSFKIPNLFTLLLDQI